MKKDLSAKYHVSADSEFEPGSRNRVLKNKLGIKSKIEMENAELIAFLEAEKKLVRIYDANHGYRNDDLMLIHKVFLGRIYEWAGFYRNVNISKDGFMFASALHLPSLMDDFEKNCLIANTPCSGEIDEAARKIAEVHCEFLLLHPFREGNGRTGRLLANLMAYQAGFPGVNLRFVGNKGKEFHNYINAVQEGMDKNYEPMKRIVLKGISLALKAIS